MSPPGGFAPLRGLCREGVAIARTQPIACALTSIVVAAVCGVIFATTGQAAAAEARVTRGIDEAGTTVIVVEDREGRGQILPTSVARIASLDRVEWVAGLSQVSDVRNVSLGESAAPVPSRVFFGTLPAEITVDVGQLRAGRALVGVGAQDRLGMLHPAGAVAGPVRQSDVVGRFRAESPMDFLNDSVLIAAPRGSAGQPRAPLLRSIYLRVRRVEDVRPVAAALRRVIEARGAEYTVVTPTQLVELREVVSSELSRSSRRLMLVVLGVGLLVVATTLVGTVSQRRRDFGRRRALGATRSDIVVLVLVQSAVAALVGVSLGAGIGLIAVWRLAGTLPSLSFALGVLSLAFLTALLAAVFPALLAARRDPVRILRVP